MTLIKLHYWLIQYITVKQGTGEVINSPCHAQVWLQENFALAHILVCTCSFGFHRVVVETPVLVNKHKIHIYTHTHTKEIKKNQSGLWYHRHILNNWLWVSLYCLMIDFKEHRLWCPSFSTYFSFSIILV